MEHAATPSPGDADVGRPRGAARFVVNRFAREWPAWATLDHGVEEPARRRLVRVWGARRAVEVTPAVERPRSVAGPIPVAEPSTARWLAPLPTARPWPLDGPPRPRTVATSGLPADAPLAAGDGRAPRSRG